MPVLQVAKSGEPYTTIQAAMLAAVDGDTIRVMDSQTYQDGQVRFDTPVPTLDNVTIEAAVGQTPTIKGTSNELIDFGYTTGNVVDGFTVDCTGSGSNYGLSFEDTSQSCIISDCTLTNCRSKFSEQAHGNKVLRCKFTGVSQFRVQNTAGLTENQFIACEFSGFTSSAIIMLSGGTTGVYGCTIDGGRSGNRPSESYCADSGGRRCRCRRANPWMRAGFSKVASSARNAAMASRSRRTSARILPTRSARSVDSNLIS